MDAVLLLLVMHNLYQLSASLKNFLQDDWCSALPVGVVLTMLHLNHGCYGPYEVTIYSRGWQKALNMFESYVL